LDERVAERFVRMEAPCRFQKIAPGTNRIGSHDPTQEMKDTEQRRIVGEYFPE
jgi:hypothetical protein